MRISQEWNSKQGCILCEDVMRDREGVKMDKRTKVKSRSHTPSPHFFCSFHLLFRSLIRNSDLRFAPVEVLGQAKRNKFRDPFAREKQIKASFICFSAHLFVTLTYALLRSKFFDKPSENKFSWSFRSGKAN